MTYFSNNKWSAHSTSILEYTSHFIFKNILSEKKFRLFFTNIPLKCNASKLWGLHNRCKFFYMTNLVPLVICIILFYIISEPCIKERHRKKMSDYIMNPVVKYNVGMPFDSFAELKSWSEEMENCRLAVYDQESHICSRIRENEKISKYLNFVRICWN